MMRVAILLILGAMAAAAETKRIVIVKLDGVPAGVLERYMAETNPRTGKSRLPWFQYIFAERGVRVANFYTRGLSLSVPSWSMLDTGLPTQIKGNVEYDRYTMWVYDYLNFITFYFKYALKRGVDMESVETLDDLHQPLLIDRFPYAAVYQSYQLFQRGVRWKTLQHMLQNRFTTRPIKELFDEWQIGLAIGSGFQEQMETELIANLQNPAKIYLDIFSGDYDHVAHLAQDPYAQLSALEKNDAMLGRVYTAIQSSPLAEETALIVVSDHGMNSSPGVYSQGFNLVDYLGTAEGGGHHVVTNRYPLAAYRLKGLYPFVFQVFTPASKSAYLEGQHEQYPTAMLDLDGNERANIHFRNSDINVLQILFEQLRRGLPEPLRRAALTEFFDVIDRHRAGWEAESNQLMAEMEECKREYNLPPDPAAKKKKFPASDKALGIDKSYLRAINQRERFMKFIAAYESYIGIVRNLMAQKRDGFNAAKVKGEEIFPQRAMGDSNTLHQLQNYVVGPGEQGIVLDAWGKLDWQRSFRRVNYFDLFLAIRTRNNVQKQVGFRPVDFTAARAGDHAVWLFAGADRQLLIEWRNARNGRLELRCVPVKNLTADTNGDMHWDAGVWKAGLPLELFEDPERNTPSEWLNGWHEEREWLRAVHRTKYSNGVIGIYEEFHRVPLNDKFQDHRRRLARTDMLLFANDHWNFNVRSFNPGGNHGSLLRVSTHSVLMMAGGARTGIKQGTVIEEPYDSLSFMPSVLHLLGRDEAALPGPLIEGLQ
jgi:hypothetical protein